MVRKSIHAGAFSAREVERTTARFSTFCEDGMGVSFLRNQTGKEAHSVRRFTPRARQVPGDPDGSEGLLRSHKAPLLCHVSHAPNPSAAQVSDDGPQVFSALLSLCRDCRHSLLVANLLAPKGAPPVWIAKPFHGRMIALACEGDALACDLQGRLGALGNQPRRDGSASTPLMVLSEAIAKPGVSCHS